LGNLDGDSRTDEDRDNREDRQLEIHDLQIQTIGGYKINQTTRADGGPHVCLRELGMVDVCFRLHRKSAFSLAPSFFLDGDGQRVPICRLVLGVIGLRCRRSVNRGCGPLCSIGSAKLNWKNVGQNSAVSYLTKKSVQV